MRRARKRVGGGLRGTKRPVRTTQASRAYGVVVVVWFGVEGTEDGRDNKKRGSDLRERYVVFAEVSGTKGKRVGQVARMGYTVAAAGVRAAGAGNVSRERAAK